MMPRCRSVAGSFCRTACIRVGVGIIASRVIVVTVACGMVGVSVGFIRMACPVVSIRSVVVGMIAITGGVFIVSDRRCCKYKGRES